MSETIYTESAKIDHIVQYIQKTDSATLYSIPTPTIRFPFDPTQDSLIMGWFCADPDEFTVLVKSAIIQELMKTKSHDVIEFAKKNLSVLITDAKKIKMHDWGPDHEGMPVSVDCMIVSQNKPETYTKYAKMHCSEGHTLEVRTLLPEIKCSQCNNTMELIQSSVKTGYIRSVLIQEPVDEAKHGTPRMFDAIIKDDDVRNTYIGQRVNIIGVFRSIPQKYKSTNRIIISILTTKSLENTQELQPTEDQVSYFTQISKQDKYLDTIAESIAPQIKFETLAKTCVLLALVGSPERELQRDMVHVFLLGDPAIGKTDILEYILFLVKKSAMAVGGTMSGSGVTVTMDTLPNRQKMPRAGIVPLCNKGVVCLDELNQLEEEDIGKLYEAMESGTIHYNKGGFDLELEARTTIVAAANPVYYAYNETHSILSNLNLPEPLISRFDLIVNMQRGKKNNIERQEIINHINLIDRIGIPAYIKKANLLETQELSAFLSYTKTFNPVFTPEADKLAKDFHLTIEGLEQHEGSLAIDNRFYQSVKRTSKAVARMFFSNDVKPEHVMIAIEIKKKALQTFGMNTEPGKRPFKTVDVKGMPEAFKFVCRDLEQKNPDGRFSEDECIKELYKQYPEYFNTIDKANVEFQKAHVNGKIGKENGRYKLND